MGPQLFALPPPQPFASLLTPHLLTCVQGVVIGGAVAPIYFCLTWSKASATGAITGALSGFVLGIVAWLVTCQGYYGKVRPRAAGTSVGRGGLGSLGRHF